MTTEALSVREALARARAALASLDGADPALDAEVLLAHLLERDRAWLYAWSEHRLSGDLTARFDALITRRADGIPVAHLTGEREFWSLRLRVGPDTLIPRPDTETLVGWALELLPDADDRSVLDLGTGTGAIALALASERPAARLIATDRSAGALTVAAENRRNLGLERVALVRGDWLEGFAPTPAFDLIVSNPPYVAAGDPHLARGDVTHEPREALVAGDHGVDDLARIVDAALPRLVPSGHLLVEHGIDQGAWVRARFQAAGYVQVETRSDLAGRPRVSGGSRPAKNLDASRG